VETKRFVGSTVNVIFTRQTCGQHSSRAAESKRRALGNYFSERICYMFLMSKCRGDRDLGLCTLWVLAKKEPLRNVDWQKKKCFARRKNRNLTLRSVFSQVPKKCIDLDLGPNFYHFVISIFEGRRRSVNIDSTIGKKMSSENRDLDDVSSW